MLQLPEIQALQALSRDGRLFFLTRTIRLFGYGMIAIILVLYLTTIGLHESEVGLLLSLTLVGDAVISLGIAGVADRIGRRRMLMAGAILMIFAGIVFALTGNFLILTIAAIIGVISPSGNEVGPFLAIEQAAIPQTTPDQHRTQVFAWYNLFGSLATAAGSLAGGFLSSALQASGSTPLASYRAVIVCYAVIGVVLLLAFTRLSDSVELQRESIASPIAGFFGLHKSRNIVFKLSGLFMLDAFAGGLVVQSFVAYWFHVKFGVPEATLGGIYFGANILAGLSSLAAARIAARYGLIRTMVGTHIPSNVLLILVPLMPNLPLAILLLLLRFSISQMDVPTRQSYVVSVVDPDERSAAAGVTSIARTTATSLSPLLTGALQGAGLFSLPFFIAGGLKIVYDLALWREFNAVKPPEEL